MPNDSSDLHLKGLQDGSDLHLGSESTSTQETHTGNADTVLENSTGVSEGQRHTIGNADTVLEDSVGNSDARFDDAIATGFAPRRYFGVGVAVLEDAVGDARSTVTSILGSIPFVCLNNSNSIFLPAVSCVTQKQGISQATKADLSTEYAASLNTAVCSDNENANPHNIQNCNIILESDFLQAITCSKHFNTTAINKELCVFSQSGSLLTVDVCDVHYGSAIEKRVENCQLIGDVSKKDYSQVNVEYPNGKPYVPSNLYKMVAYEKKFKSKITRHQFVKLPTVFKMVAADFSDPYKTEAYGKNNFYKQYVVFPPADVEYASQEMDERLYVAGDTTPVHVVSYAGMSPLSSLTCNAHGNSTVTNIKTCDVQEEGSLVLRNSCIPYTDAPQVILPPPPPVDPPDTGVTIVVPTKEVYTVQNTITTVTLADDDIDLNDLSLSFDADSHSWIWSAQLVKPDQLALLLPAADGTEVEIHVTLNGVEMYLLVEQVANTKSFNSTSISISGRGLSALLDAPYERADSVLHGTLLTNQQIAESFLPIDWTLVWDMPIWNIPPNTYSHQNLTPAEALRNFALACGGMLIPSLNSKTLTVKKRYPVVPWQFANVNPDLIIPDDIIISLREEPTARYGANGVYVHGFEGGKQALCKLGGTAGDRLATTEANALMVDAVAIRTMGERALAGAYVQPKIRSINTVMDGGTTIPLVNVGIFIELNVENILDRGIVSAISINATFGNDDALTIEQNITLGEETSNTFSLFSKLIPTEALRVAESISTQGTSSVVQLVDGSEMTVRGASTVGNKYYIKGASIEGEAPSVDILNEITV